MMTREEIGIVRLSSREFDVHGLIPHKSFALTQSLRAPGLVESLEVDLD